MSSLSSSKGEPCRYMLSIIIPHYNTPDLLEKLLWTIPNRDNIQIIVVDDHSDQKTRLRLKKMEALFSDRNVSFLNNDTSEHNAGAARNIGLKYAEGKWLLFADADDSFPGAFYHKVQKSLNTDCDIVFFSPVSIQLETGKRDIRHERYADLVRNYLRKPCQYTETALRYGWCAPWSKLIRTSMIRSHNIQFSSVRYCNDVMFSAQTGFCAGKITASSETIYCVSYRPGSLTTHLDEGAFDIRVQEMVREFQFLRDRLSEKELWGTGIRSYAVFQLSEILLRGYGLRCFARYLVYFQKNKMFFFRSALLHPFRSVRWIVRWAGNFIHNYLGFR